ncbi:hypothetical protein GS501_02680 [Saccharibacter sp. 17.LH.SD]|uniref:hypothetical protein n=1 Tax=Saccharibacter sp. 17.LH.SD TaxID=2689393 RepID=UPI00136B3766|nr:hypothetical protein [Saccharibacter sp. 17.LH.SD]MXV43959.1 hypothetical protein [Saccharibacter sp. 17.LH.SD]
MSYFHKICGVGGALMVSLFTAFPTSGHAEALGDHPVLTPMRDVVVTYQFQDNPNPGATMKNVTISFEASGNRLRIDRADLGGVTILDRLSQRVTLIKLDTHQYIQFVPLHGLRNPFLLDLNMAYHAEEKRRVAGYECQNWSIDTTHGKAEACVTDDGVILSESGVDADGVTGRLEAVQVDYRAIPASAFEPPAGFQKFQPLQTRKGPPAQPAGGSSAPPVAAGQNTSPSTP